jgi:hypothetical protein
MSLTEDPAATEAETPPSPPSPLELSIAELGKKYRDGTLSPVDVVEASFSHIEKFDPTLNAFLRLTKERALTDAERLATELKQGKDRGPYHGLPYALKDNVDTAGILSTSHSKLFADRIPSENAGVVENLEAGGGILLGKLATFEFALGGPSWDLPAPTGAQSLEPGLSAWRILFGIGRRRCSLVRSWCDRNRYRRFRALAGRCMRSGRPEAHLWAHQPPRRSPEHILARPLRSADT